MSDAINIEAIVADAIGAVPDDLKTTVTFTRSTPGSYDPLTDASSGPTVTSVVGTAVQVPGDLDQYKALGLVSTSARTLVFVPDTVGESPLEGDSIVWASDGYTVRSVDPTEPAGTTLAVRVVINR